MDTIAGFVNTQKMFRPNGHYVYGCSRHVACELLIRVLDDRAFSVTPYVQDVLWYGKHTELLR